MKTSLILCVFFLMACLATQGKADCPGFKDCGPLKTGEICTDQCVPYECQADGSYTSSGCAEFRCKKQIGYQETDLSKPFPDCCPRPICG
ncbi:hypothetical protein HCN44_003310 [Aphidius gifuensis]|uniref:Single domain-containing protein n=1 Tax=Aphidius gifuensis TaxID=684658 RepID=A0A834XJX4_APHGI|nr:uncharacterized protein LOC122859009 [Aphidius gifuensis]KAF7987548.1 hypothetical protein HCN44_003310 [Aphidius gifuensis]